MPLRTIEQAAGHLRWKVGCPTSQWVWGSNLTGGSRPAKLPSFGGYSLLLGTLTYAHPCLRILCHRERWHMVCCLMKSISDLIDFSAAGHNQAQNDQPNDQAGC